MNTTAEKCRELKEYLSSLGSVAVAFSGGVDSAFLLQTAHDVLGENAVAVTVSLLSFPKRELDEAKLYCSKNGIRQIIVQLDELRIDGFSRNPENRCYLCKRKIFGKILEIAKEEGISAVLEGSNADDEGDYRPGLIAVKELGVKSPLRELKLSKKEIRSLSKESGLPTWNKPSYACLASRFVYGEAITGEKLKMVDKAEQLLIDLGFQQVRVRIHGRIARIEILPEEFPSIIKDNTRNKIYKALKELGFTYVSLDLSGYRTGSMNETLNM